MNKAQIILAGTRNELQKINEDLQRNCGSSYKLELLQYRFRDAEAVVYDETSNEYDIILCLYHENRCVSSVTGRYSQSTNSMELLSKTDVKYEGLKYNLYLRTIFIYLMCFVRPTIQRIFSHATNPISTYTMYKHYHATNPDLQEYVGTHNLTPETFTLEEARHFHTYFTEKYQQTTESAEKELDEMLEYCSADYGTECSVEDLGWETKEAAIEFIMTTMNVKTITLEFDLENPGVKEFLLNKLSNTPIKCTNTHVSQKRKLEQTITGGKFSRRKSCRKSYRKTCRKTCRKTYRKTYRKSCRKSYRKH
jgi:hypothetical protein